MLTRLELLECQVGLGNDLGNLLEPPSEVFCGPSEVLEDTVHRLSEVNSCAVIAPVLQNLLQNAEEALSPWNSQHHGLKLSQ
jgi:hypothetical protein